MLGTVALIIMTLTLGGLLMKLGLIERVMAPLQLTSKHLVN